MKLVFAMILVLGLQAFAQAETLEENRAVEIKFYGGLTGFDEGAYRAVKSSLTSFIVEGVVDHYITRAVGLEGGSTICVELGVDPKLSIEPILKVLRSIQPGENSFYRFSPILNCSQ